MAIKIKEINIKIHIEKKVVNHEENFFVNISRLELRQLPEPLLEELYEYYQSRNDIEKKRFKDLRYF